MQSEIQAVSAGQLPTAFLADQDGPKSPDAFLKRLPRQSKRIEASSPSGNRFGSFQLTVPPGLLTIQVTLPEPYLDNSLSALRRD
jgi:hypothetical protein